MTSGNTSKQNKIVEIILQSEMGYSIKNKIHNSLPDHFESKQALKDKMKTLLSNAEIKQSICNEIYRFNSKYKVNQGKEEVDYLLEAQKKWEEQLIKSINTIASERGKPLAAPMGDHDVANFRRKWKSLGTEMNEDTNYKPIYSQKDLFAYLCKIRNPNYKEFVMGQETRGTLGLIKIPLATIDIKELQNQFIDLSLDRSHIGVEQADNSNTNPIEEQVVLALSAASTSSLIPVALRACRFGVTPSLRCTLWPLALDIDLESRKGQIEFINLEKDVLTNSLLLDQIFINDVKSNSANDDNYFVFEDPTLQVLLCAARDYKMMSMYTHSNASPLKCVNKLIDGGQEIVAYPPSGLIPMYGVSYFISPLCYVFSHHWKIYSTFTAMYTRYFHKLTVISTDTNSILSLSKHFEMLLIEKHPMLFLHLISCGIQPLKFAFRWMTCAFAGYLEAEQVLLLWDRIIGFKSLLLLPIAATAIFEFRSSNLMQVQRSEEAEAVLYNLNHVAIIPLIQQFLFVPNQLLI
ncbi:TBC1 domain family member 19 [Oopsacas minuta]|uniref:TBC1 domain family member 19 n=1 Tax=Oopsacas minuta TaxID=111878 RepID=A0AAV7KAU1_9METZ|nr:TBC1 domain family member 19 [Oopsacas minuta]